MRPFLLLVALFTFALAPDTTAQIYKDTEVGFRIFPGRKLKHVERGYRHFRSKYLMAAFRDERGYPTGMGSFYKPMVFCLLFPANQQKVTTGKEDAKTKEKGSARLTEEELNKRWQTQYLNFDELALHQIKGFYFGQPRKIKVSGLEGTLKEMIFEKGQLQQRWLTANFNVKGNQFTIIHTCTEKRYAKEKGAMLAVIKSFRLIDRKQGLTFVEKPMPKMVQVENDGALTAEENALPQKERNKILLKKAEKVIQKKIDSLPKGWRHLRTHSGRYLILSHVDNKFTREIARRAEAINAWLEANFGEIGQGAVPPAIIRIYKDKNDLPPDAESARISIRTSGALVEIVILKRYEWSDPKRGERVVTSSITDKWFSYRNEDLWDRMPAWMSDGIIRFLTSADLRGRSLKFKPDVDEKTALNQAFVTDRNLEKKGKPAVNIKPLEELVKMTREEQWKGAGWSGVYFPYQCGSFIRFLFMGPGRRMKQTKGIIKTYIEELNKELVEVQKRIKAGRKSKQAREAALKDMTDEERLKAEDEKYQRRRKEQLDSQEKIMLRNVFEKTFGKLSARQWKQVQKTWENFAGK